jgi:dihydroneopterin aldolase
VAKVVLQGMSFHAHHGVYPEETKLGGRYLVDVELTLDDPSVDEVAHTADYGAVYARVRELVTGERYRLIEVLAARIADDLLAREVHLRAVLVRVHKPHAPLPGVFGDVYVEVTRSR